MLQRHSAAIAALMFSAVAIFVATAAPRVVTVQLLAINDFHGALEPPAGSNGKVGEVDAGGAQYLAPYLARAVAGNPNSIFVAAGDLIGASPLLSSALRDEPTIEALDAMHLAVSAVGNHEFDRGWPELVRLQKRASFRYLAANVTRTTERGAAAIFPGHTIRIVGGVKIGFIGETLRDTLKMLVPAASKDLNVADEADTANREAAILKRQGVNAIILLIHEGGRQDTAASIDDPNGCRGFSGAIEPIARRLSPDIAVIISGHTHRAYNCVIDSHHVTSAMSLGRLVTRIGLTIDAGSDRIVTVSAVNEIVTRDVLPDARQTSIIARSAATVRPIAMRPVGTLRASLLRAPNDAGESALGDVIADAQLAAARELTGAGADVAFMNHGGIRADLTGRRESAGTPLTVNYNDLFSVQPFGNSIMVMTMTGQMVKDVLEQQGFGKERRILEASSGFTYRYSANAPNGAHVDPSSMMLHGRRILPDDRLRVVANDFLMAGGDGYTAFARGKDVLSAGPDIDALEKYVRAHSPLELPPLDRIVRTD
jgi:5'-nucleotidase